MSLAGQADTAQDRRARGGTAGASCRVRRRVGPAGGRSRRAARRGRRAEPVDGNLDGGQRRGRRCLPRSPSRPGRRRAPKAQSPRPERAARVTRRRVPPRQAPRADERFGWQTQALPGGTIRAHSSAISAQVCTVGPERSTVELGARRYGTVAYPPMPWPIPAVSPARPGGRRPEGEDISSTHPSGAAMSVLESPSTPSRPSAVVSPEQPQATDRRSWAVLAVALIAQILVVLDISVVNTALPTIGRSLQLDSSQLQWLVTAYLLMSGGGLLLGGRIADLLPAPARVHDRAGPVHVRVAGRRVRRQRRRAHRGPRHPGPGRRPDDPGRPRTHHDHLLRRTACPRPGPVGCRRQHGCRSRRAVRRCAHHLGRLADHLLGQRALRHRRLRRRDRRAAQGNVPARRAQPAGPPRRDHRRRRARRTPARYPGRRTARLDLAPHARRCSLRPPVCWPRSPRSRSASPARWSRRTPGRSRPWCPGPP